MTLFKGMIIFLKELHRRNRVFFSLGMGLSVLFIVFLIGFEVCSYSLFEVCHWLKPGKFILSFAVYVISLGWYLEYLKDNLGPKKIKRLSLAISLLIVIEIGVIVSQSFMISAVYSGLQFSDHTTKQLARSLFVLGNAFILANTAIAIYIVSQFFRDIKLKPISYLWGIRAGFVIFVLSCFLGLFLLGHFGQIPPDPSRYGIPFTRFSTTRDNLISLHFLGIHFLQVFPLCCYFFQRQIGKIFSLSSVLVYSSACIFFILKA